MFSVCVCVTAVLVCVCFMLCKMHIHNSSGTFRVVLIVTSQQQRRLGGVGVVAALGGWCGFFRFASSNIECAGGGGGEPLVCKCGSLFIIII